MGHAEGLESIQQSSQKEAHVEGLESIQESSQKVKITDEILNETSQPSDTPVGNAVEEKEKKELER